MTAPQKIKPFGLRPIDPLIPPVVGQWMDQVQTALNQLIAQTGSIQSGLLALSTSAVNPSTAGITSLGSRVQSLSTAFQYVIPSAATSITFYWDGTNSSVPLTIYRDDGTILPRIYGNFNVTGLNPSTTYFFYPYYDEPSGTVKWATAAGAVGTPPVAFATTQSLPAAQVQLMRNHIPLALLLAATGIAFPAGGGGGGSGSGGGGGGGGSGGGGHYTK
jgi:uncharacterized membrane protein YgcG